MKEFKSRKDIKHSRTVKLPERRETEPCSLILLSRVLIFYYALKSLDFFKHKFLGPKHIVSDSAGIVYGLQMWISNKFLGNKDMADLDITTKEMHIFTT